MRNHLPPDGHSRQSGLPSAAADPLRLQQALGLIFSGPTAVRLVERYSTAGQGDLGEFVHDAVWEYRIERVLAWFRRRMLIDDLERPLFFGFAAPSRSAVLYALYAGAGLEPQFIADQLGLSVDRVVSDLEQARRALDPTLPAPCGACAVPVSRVRDRSIDRDEQIEILTHLQGCERCRVAVQRFHEMDERVLSQVPHAMAVRGHATGGRTFISPRQLATVVAALLILGGVLSAGALVSRVVSGGHEAVPIAIEQAEPPLEGWLLVAHPDQGVLARNLATRQPRQILDPSGDIWSEYYLSPDKLKIARFRSSAWPSGEAEIIVTSITGAELARLDWSGSSSQASLDPQRNRFVLGWLDNDRLLMKLEPMYTPGESEAEYRSRAAASTQIVATNWRSRAETVLWQGGVADASVSPDGTRIALAHYDPPSENKLRLELRPVRPDGIGGLLAVLDRGIDPGGGLVWSEDSSTLYAIQVGPGRPNTGSRQATSLRPAEAAKREIVAVDRDGHIQSAVQLSGRNFIQVVGASRDGHSAIYIEHQASSDSPSMSFWRIVPGAALPERLTEPHEVVGWWGSDVIWSPSSDLVLGLDVRPLYMSTDHDDQALGQPSVTAVRAFGDGFNGDMLELWFGWGWQVIGWLPAGAYAADPLPVDGSISVSPPETVPDLLPGHVLAPESRANLRGRHVLMTDIRENVPVIWDREAGRQRRLAGGASSPSWLPDGSGLIGVSGQTERWSGPSRLMLFATQSSESSVVYDFRRFDPARLGIQETLRYAAPKVAPDGSAISFFTVDRQRGEVMLWITTWRGDPAKVASWNASASTLDAVPLVSSWANGHTLLYAQPGDWNNGLPQNTSLVRAMVDNDGNVMNQQLVRFGPRGDDRGIAMAEISMSPNGADIAWRMRHYRSRDRSGESYDTLHLASTSDIRKTVELARGASGEGIDWSPDSTWFAAAIKDRVMVLSARDLSYEYLGPDDGRASLPVVIDDHELWFAWESRGETLIMRSFVGRATN